MEDWVRRFLSRLLREPLSSVPTPREFSEAIWAGLRAGGEDGAAPSESTPPPDADASPPQDPPPEDLDEDADPDDGERDLRQPQVHEAETGADVARFGNDVDPGERPPDAERWPGRQVRIPLDPAEPLEQPLDFARAFQRLARHRPARDRMEVDLQRTIRGIATSGFVVLERRPVLRKSTRFLWLVDEAGQLAPWHRMLGQLYEIQERMAPFASVEVVGVDLREPDRARFHLLGPQLDVRSGELELPDLVRPGDDHLVALVTDGLSAGVGGGALGRALAALPSDVRVVWLHPWPEVHWWRSGVARLSAGRVGTPGAVVLPVVELSPKGLGQLTGHVQGRSGEELPAVVLPKVARVQRVSRPGARLEEPAARVRGLARSLQPASLELLALAACVPGRIDLRLLRALGGRFVPAAGRFACAEVLSAGVFDRVHEPGRVTVQVRESYRQALLAYLPEVRLRSVLEFLVGRYLRSNVPESALDEAHRLQIPVHLVQRAVEPDAAEAAEADVIEAEAAMAGSPILLDTLRRAAPELTIERLIRPQAQPNHGTRLRTLQVGEIVAGTVAGIASFGVFVNVGGPAGLLHRSTLPAVMPSPELLFRSGDKLDVRIDAIGDDGRIAVSYACTDEDRALAARFPIGAIVEARVVGPGDDGDVAQVGEYPAVLRGVASGTHAPGDHVTCVVTHLRLVTRSVGIQPAPTARTELELATVLRTATSAHLGTLGYADGRMARIDRTQLTWPIVPDDVIEVTALGSGPPERPDVSERRAIALRAGARWGGLPPAGTAVSARGVRRFADGVLVEVDEVRAAIPAALAERAEGEELPCRVVWTDAARYRIWLAPEVVWAAWPESTATLPALGARLDVEVLALLPFGALVYGGGVRGVVPWEAFFWDAHGEVDARIAGLGGFEAVVVDVDRLTGQVLLDHRVTTPDPFSGAGRAVGDAVRGRITHVSARSVFVDVGDGQAVAGAEALGYGWLDDARLAVAPGDPFEGVVRVWSASARRFEVERPSPPPGDPPPAVAEQLAARARVKLAAERGETLHGTVERATAVALEVRLEGGVAATLPVAEAGARDPRGLVGSDVEVAVLSISETRRGVIVSRKPVFAAQVARLKSGDVVHGRVASLTDYGVFVDLGFIVGLLHFTELSHGRPPNPRDLFAEGDELDAVVLRISDEHDRVWLSYKQLLPDPWLTVGERYPVGSVVEGLVVGVWDHNARVELEPGIFGVIELAALTWNHRVKSATKLVAPGDLVKAEVVGIDEAARTVSLDVRRLQPDPWAAWVAEHGKGTRLRRPISNFADYGMFLRLDDGIDGLLHVTDLSWFKLHGAVSDRYEKGETLEVELVDVDLEARRIRLGLRQLTPDPWTTSSVPLEGQTFEGRVIVGADRRLVCVESPPFDGRLDLDDLAWPTRATLRLGLLATGDRLRVRITSANPITRSLTLADASEVPPLAKEVARVRRERRPTGVVVAVGEDGVVVRLSPQLLGVIGRASAARSWRWSTARVAERVGDVVPVTVVGVDEDAGLVMLRDPQPEAAWSVFADLPRGARVTGLVTEAVVEGLAVEIGPGVEGLVPWGSIPAELSAAMGRTQFRVVEVLAGPRMILLSLEGGPAQLRTPVLQDPPGSKAVVGLAAHLGAGIPPYFDRLRARFPRDDDDGRQGRATPAELAGWLVAVGRPPPPPRLSAFRAGGTALFALVSGMPRERCDEALRSVGLAGPAAASEAAYAALVQWVYQPVGPIVPVMPTQPVAAAPEADAGAVSLRAAWMKRGQKIGRSLWLAAVVFGGVPDLDDPTLPPQLVERVVALSMLSDSLERGAELVRALPGRRLTRPAVAAARAAWGGLPARPPFDPSIPHVVGALGPRTGVGAPVIAEIATELFGRPIAAKETLGPEEADLLDATLWRSPIDADLARAPVGPGADFPLADRRLAIVAAAALAVMGPYLSGSIPTAGVQMSGRMRRLAPTATELAAALLALHDELGLVEFTPGEGWTLRRLLPDRGAGSGS